MALDAAVVADREAGARFAMTYQAMAEESRCDSPGGMEFWRVFGEWIEAGAPLPCTEFIQKRANVGPFGK